MITNDKTLGKVNSYVSCLFLCYLQVPCVNDHDNICSSLESFKNSYPLFELLGDECPIGSELPYDVDYRVQLVCKYLKAKEEGSLDQLAKRKLNGYDNQSILIVVCILCLHCG